MTLRSARAHVARLFDGSPWLCATANRNGLVPGCMDLTWGELAELVGYVHPGVVMNPPPDDDIQRVADVIIGRMFAPHELPLDDDLNENYRETARCAINAMAVIPESEK